MRTGRLILASCVLSGPAFGLAGLRAEAAPASGSLEFERREADLGDLYQHDVRALEFAFRVGDAPCTVQAIQTSCGCAHGKLAVAGEAWPLGKEIPAGTEGVVKVDFKTGQYVGEKHATVTLKLGEEDPPEVLSVRAFIKKVFEVEPSMARFGNVTRSEATSIRVKVTGIAPWEFVRWTKIPPGIAVEETEAELPEEAATAPAAVATRWFEVQVLPTARLGGIYGSATAETSLDKPFTIQVNAQVVGAVVFRPNDRLNFGVVTPGQAQVLPLTIENRSKSMRMPVPEITLEESELFTVETKAPEEPGRVELRLYFSADAPPGRHATTLHVTWTGDFAPESKRIPVSAVVRSGPR